MNIVRWATPGRSGYVCADRRLYRALVVWMTKSLTKGENGG